MPYGFVEQWFQCSICDAKFKALTGKDVVVSDPVCTDCGLKYSAEKRKRLTDERKQRMRRQ